MTDPSAFESNSLSGLQGPFPLSFELQRHSRELFSTYVQAQRVATLVDLLNGTDFRRLCVFGVDHFEFVPETNALVSLRDVAREGDLQFEAVDADTLVLDLDALKKLLDRIAHYNLSLFDVPDAWSLIDVEEAVLVLREPSSDYRILDALPDSDLYINSHDDCYLYAECRTESLVADQLATLLQEYAQAVGDRPVPCPPASLCRSIWARSLTLSSSAQLCSSNSLELILGFSAEPRRTLADFGELQTDFRLILEVDGPRWKLDGL